MARKKSSFGNTIVDFLELFIISAVVFIMVYLYVGQLLEVTGESMEPTLENKEQLIAEKLSIKFTDIERGEIVIFKHPEYQSKLIIKRVIGLPGEEITIQNDKVYIDGVALEEDYLGNKVYTKPDNAIKNGIPYEIPDGEYVLMGDNRNNSEDSRDWGALPIDLIIGRALLVYYPLSNFRVISH